MTTRRQILQGVALASVGSLYAIRSIGASGGVYPRPDPTLFQSGDLVWPKKPGAYVPYNSGNDRSVASDQMVWEREKNEYIQTLKAKPNLDSIETESIRLLSTMTFRDFLAIYEGNQTPGIPGAYSGSGFYVGHVAIVEIDSNNTPWVIEAVLPQGVRRMTYADWLASRPDQMIWLGRLRDISSGDRAGIPEEAKKYLSKPYKFWNFNLNDDGGFYCSKLVWLSIFRALHFAVDGNNNPKRFIWFSPKQLLYCATIDRIHDPGPYAYQ
jgi:hypothetical protein